MNTYVPNEQGHIQNSEVNTMANEKADKLVCAADVEETPKEGKPRQTKVLKPVQITKEHQQVGIPVKVNIDSGGKPNGIPERR
jgi:hypothetical protein